MRLNIFSIPAAEVELLKEKLSSTGMIVIKEVTQSGWKGEFFYSPEPHGKPTGWAKTYASYFGEDVHPPRSLSYWAALVSRSRLVQKIDRSWWRRRFGTRGRLRRDRRRMA